MHDHTAIDSKTSDVGTNLEDLKYAFEAFKETNERALAEAKARGAVDPVTSDKLDRINRTLDAHQRRFDEMSLKAQRPQLGMPSTSHHTRSHAEIAHKAGFEGYVRKGETAGLLELEGKALSVGSNTDGGYLVPPETEAAVTLALRAISPIRAISAVRQVSSSVYKKPFSVNGLGAGWVGETTARPQTSTPTIDALSFPTMELYAMPAATSSLLDDSAVNIDQWIADEVRVAFAQQEGSAFVTGDGVNKPRGFLSYQTVANASWTWGNIGTISTGIAGAFPATNPYDKLIDLIYSVKAGYRTGASFVMNRATQAQMRKFKDLEGDYLWTPAQRPGDAPSLMGYPVVEAEDMPDIAADATALAFGDFQRGYLVVDRVGLRVLRDPYSAKPYVLFYTTKRVGGGVQDFNAIKLMKFGV